MQTENGNIREKVWTALNNRFLRLEKSGYFFPLEPMDAYNRAAAELERVAESLASGAIVLKKSTPNTYLIAVAYRSFNNFHKYSVLPCREEYRLVERKVLAKEESDSIKAAKNAAEGADVGVSAYAGACETGENAEPAQPMTAQHLAENLPAQDSYEVRRAKARHQLCEICEKLDYQTKRVFAAYIRSDGDFSVMAASLHISLATCYRRYTKAITLARKEV